MLIWWLSEADYDVIGEPRETWPEYLQEQYYSREGRPGRGRLWVASHFTNASVDDWPSNALGDKLARDYGGIVIDDADAIHVKNLSGILTDMVLNTITE